MDFPHVTGPLVFTREYALQAVAKLIVTNNNVSITQNHHELRTRHHKPLALADNTAFRNALVAMRPKSSTKDLPSSHDVSVYIHNEFVKHTTALKEELRVRQVIITSA